MFSIKCGDFSKLGNELPPQSIDLIITDPPFGVGFKNDFYDDNIEYVLSHLDDWFLYMFNALKLDGFVFMFVGLLQIHNFINKAISTGFTFKNIIATRNYNNGSKRPKNNFGFQFQPILVLSKGKGRKLNNVDIIKTSDGWLKDKRNKNPNIYTYEYPNFLKPEWFYATAKTASKSIHPNEKNIDLIKFLIKVASNETEIVLDPFMGSGSTGVAAVQTNRSFIGIDISRYYCDKAKERLDTIYESIIKST